MLKLSLVTSVLVVLAACSATPSRFAVPVVTPELRQPISFRTVELREVSLPVYAQSEEISVEGLDGGITVRSGLLWADLPARAMTLDLGQALRTITGAQVASEPWPFDARPQARLEVRVEEMIASERGEFRLSGQYFVGAFDGSERGRAQSFALSVPLDPDAGPAAIALARGTATVLLAEAIARDGLR
jgi:uncharacterized lipoprotein YmbA